MSEQTNTPNLRMAVCERAYRSRCYPTKAQARLLAQLFGARRYVWNWALARREEVWRERRERISHNQLSKELTALRNQPGFEWLGALPRAPLQQALRDLEEAYKRFFHGLARRPRRKRRSYSGSVRFQVDHRSGPLDFGVEDGEELPERGTGYVRLDGVGWLKFRFTEKHAGKLTSVTVRRDSAGRFFVSFATKTAPRPEWPAAPKEAAVGIDLGVSALVTTSDGEKVPVCRNLEVKERRLRRYQRSQARKLRAAMVRAGLDPSKPPPKGFRVRRSRRFVRNGIRIARLHAQVRDARQNLLHQTTTALVARYQLIAIEDLSVKGMARGLPRLRQRIANACMGEFRRQLEYKARWAGRKVVVVDRFFASSQLCSECGAQNKDLKLSERRWRCAACGAEHDRDVNAAKNTLAEALRMVRREASYPQEVGKVTREECPEGQKQTSARGLGTMNRELIAKPAVRARRRRACREQAKAPTA